MAVILQSDNYSALSKASDGGFVNIVRLLISRGANINLAPPEVSRYVEHWLVL